MTFSMPIHFYIALFTIPTVMIIAMFITEHYQAKDKEEQERAKPRE